MGKAAASDRNALLHPWLGVRPVLCCQLSHTWQSIDQVSSHQGEHVSVNGSGLLLMGRHAAIQIRCKSPFSTVLNCVANIALPMSLQSTLHHPSIDCS